MKTQISFLPPVNSIDELKNVVPNTSIAYACDVSNLDRHAFFVFTNGAWIEKSHEIVEHEVCMRLGDQIKLIRSDGTETSAVFTYIKGVAIAHEIHRT